LALHSAVLFLAVVPATIGLLLGASRAGLAAHLPWGAGVAFWVVSSVGVWICLYLGTVGAARVLLPWDPPAWVVLTTGAMVGSLVGRYVIFGTAYALRDLIVDDRVPMIAPPFELTGRFIGYYLQGWAGVYVAWIAIALGLDAWHAGQVDRRSREAGPGDAPSTSSAPQLSHRNGDVDAFLVRLPPAIGRDVIALEAEDHYVRVHTMAGSALILMRFSDAITLLAALDGLRVHRSYWVRRSSVAETRSNGRGMTLLLDNGLHIPVSEGYKALVRQSDRNAPARA